jgi:hypothetical protein
MVLDDARWVGVDRAITDFFTDKDVSIEFENEQAVVYKK